MLICMTSCPPTAHGLRCLVPIPRKSGGVGRPLRHAPLGVGRGQRASGRCAMQPPLPRAKNLSCVKKNPSFWPHRYTTIISIERQYPTEYGGLRATTTSRRDLNDKNTDQTDSVTAS